MFNEVAGKKAVSLCWRPFCVLGGFGENPTDAMGPHGWGTRHLCGDWSYSVEWRRGVTRMRLETGLAEVGGPFLPLRRRLGGTLFSMTARIQ